MEGITIPRVASIRGAVEIYYQYNDLRTPDIMQLFGCSSTKARQLKKPVMAVMRERGIMMRTSGCVDTETAFEIWGLDIKALERKAERAEKLGIGREVTT